MNAAEELATTGTLTNAEREDYDLCVSTGTFIAILQAKARRMLGQNGAASWTLGFGRRSGTGPADGANTGGFTKTTGSSGSRSTM
jgi:hypothetical protein